jgi:hypothetical protein
MSTTDADVKKESESTDHPVLGIGAAADAERAEAVRSPSPGIGDKVAFSTPVTDKAAAGGQAVIDQREAIPTTGKRVPTSRWEYITFCIFCELTPRLLRHAMFLAADNLQTSPSMVPVS